MQIYCIMKLIYIFLTLICYAQINQGWQLDVNAYRKRIQVLTESIHQMDPYHLVICEKSTEQEEREPQVPKLSIGEISETSSRNVNFADNGLKIDQHVFHPGSISYADVAAGRTSPCFFEKNKDHISPECILHFHKTEIISNEGNSKITALESHNVQTETFSLVKEKERDMTDHSSGPNVTSLAEISETPMGIHMLAHRNYHPWKKIESNIICDKDSDSIMNRQSDSEPFSTHVQRPVWSPGSLTYADILRGKHGHSYDLSDIQKLPSDSLEVTESANQLREVPDSDYYQNISLANSIPSSLSSHSLPLLSTAESSESPKINEISNFQEQTHFQPEICISVFENLHQQSSLHSDLVGTISSPESLLGSNLEIYQSPIHQCTEEPSESFKSNEVGEINNKSIPSHEMKPMMKAFSSQLDTVQQHYKTWKRGNEVINALDPCKEDSNIILNNQSFSSQKLEQGMTQCYSVPTEEKREIDSSSTLSKEYLDIQGQAGITKCHLSYAQILAHGLNNKQINMQHTTNYLNNENKTFEKHTLTNQSELDFTSFPESGVSDNRTFSNEAPTFVPNYDECERKIDDTSRRKQADFMVQHNTSTKYNINSGDVQKEYEKENAMFNSELKNVQEYYSANRMKKVSSPKKTGDKKTETAENSEIISKECTLPSICDPKTDDESKKSACQIPNSDLAEISSATKKKKSKKKKKKTMFLEDKSGISVDNDAYNVEEDNEVGTDVMRLTRDTEMEIIGHSLAFHDHPMYVDNFSETQSNKVIVKERLVEENISCHDSGIEYEPIITGAQNGEKKLVSETFESEFSVTHAAESSVFDVMVDSPSSHLESCILSNEEKVQQGAISKQADEFQFTDADFQKSISNSEVCYEDQFGVNYIENVCVPNTSNIASIPESYGTSSILMESTVVIEDKQEKRKRKKRGKKKTSNIKTVTGDSTLHSANVVLTKKHDEIQSLVLDTDNITLGAQLYGPCLNKQEQTMSSGRTYLPKENEIFSYDNQCMMKKNTATNIMGRDKRKMKDSESDKSEKHLEYLENNYKEVKINKIGNKDIQVEITNLEDEGKKQMASHKKIKRKDIESVFTASGAGSFTKAGINLADETSDPMSYCKPENNSEITCVPCSVPEVSFKATDNSYMVPILSANNKEQFGTEVIILEQPETNINEHVNLQCPITPSISQHQRKNKNKSYVDNIFLEQTVKSIPQESIIPSCINTHDSIRDVENENYTFSTVLQRHKQCSGEAVSDNFIETVHFITQEKKQAEDMLPSVISSSLLLEHNENKTEAQNLGNIKNDDPEGEIFISKIPSNENLLRNLMNVSTEEIEKKYDESHSKKDEKATNMGIKQSVKSDTSQYPLKFGNDTVSFVGEINKKVSEDNYCIQEHSPIFHDQQTNLECLSSSHAPDIETEQVSDNSFLVKLSLQAMSVSTGESEHENNSKQLHHHTCDSAVKNSKNSTCDEESEHIKASSSSSKITQGDCTISVVSEISSNTVNIFENVTHEDKKNLDKQLHSENANEEVINTRNVIKDQRDSGNVNDFQHMSKENDEVLCHVIPSITSLRTVENTEEMLQENTKANQSHNVSDMTFELTKGIKIHSILPEDSIHTEKINTFKNLTVSPNYHPLIAEGYNAVDNAVSTILPDPNKSQFPDISKAQLVELTPDTINEQENKINMQQQRIAESLVRTVWPYYLYIDAEKTWKMRLPHEERERHFSEPPPSLQNLEIETVCEEHISEHTQLNLIEELKAPKAMEDENINPNEFLFTFEFHKYPIHALLEAERVWKEREGFSSSKTCSEDSCTEENKQANDICVMDKPKQILKPETQTFTNFSKDSQSIGGMTSHTLVKNISIDDSFLIYSMNTLLDAERNWRELCHNAISEVQKENILFTLNGETNELCSKDIGDQSITQENRTFHYSPQTFQIKSEYEIEKGNTVSGYLLMDDSFSKYSTTALHDAERGWKELAAYYSISEEAKKLSCSERNEETDESNNVALWDQKIMQKALLTSSSKYFQSKDEIQDETCHTLASHLILDDSFWTNKWCFDDAECKWQEHQARSFHSLKLQAVPPIPIKGNCSGSDEDGEDGDCNIPAAPGLVEWQTEDDGAHLIMKKTLAFTDLQKLHSSLEECEKKLTSLSSDSLRSMYDDIVKIRDSLRIIDVKVEQLQETNELLPADQDVQSLNFAASDMRHRIITLLSYTEQGCTSIEKIQVQQEQQLQNILNYEVLLNEIDGWCIAATAKLRTILQSLPCKDIVEQRTSFEVISHELVQHEKKLNDLISGSQPQTQYLQLGKSLHLQLTSVRSLLTDVDVQLTASLVTSEEPVITEVIENLDMKEGTPSVQKKLHSVAEHKSCVDTRLDLPIDPSPHLALDKKDVQVTDNLQLSIISPEKVIATLHDERDNTIDSNASPIADEEVSIQSMPEEEPEQQLYENKIAFHVASQTGDSLKEPQSPVHPVPTRDVAVEFHQPVDTQVQTTNMTTTSAQTSITSEKGRDKIKILKKFDDHEEIVEIATQHIAENMKDVSDLDDKEFKDKHEDKDNFMVEVKFKGKKAKEKETLQTAGDTNEISTEVIVEADRRKRIVLKTSHSVGAEVVVDNDKIYTQRDDASSEYQKPQLSPILPVEDPSTQLERESVINYEICSTENIDMQTKKCDVECKSSFNQGTLEEYVPQLTMSEHLGDSDKLGIKEQTTGNLKICDTECAELSAQVKDEKLLLMSNEFTTDVCIKGLTSQESKEITKESEITKETENKLFQKKEADSADPVEVMKQTNLQFFEDRESSSPSLPVVREITNASTDLSITDKTSKEYSDDVNKRDVECTSEKRQIVIADTDDISLETSLAESMEVIISTEVDKISSDSTKPTELERIFLDMSSVQSHSELDSTYAQETGYEPEDISSEMSISEKKKKKRKKRTKHTSGVELSPQINVDSADINNEEKKENVIKDDTGDLQHRNDNIACEENKYATGEVILSNIPDNKKDLPIEKNSLSYEVSDIVDEKYSAPDNSSTSAHPESVHISPNVVTDPSVQATVQVTMETEQCVSPTPFILQDKIFITPVVPLSECETQTSPEPETQDHAIQTLSPILEAQRSTQVSPNEHIDSSGTKQDTMLLDSEITHCATQVSTETEEGYMQTSPVEQEQIISDVADVSLQTVIDTYETHDSFVQTSPEHCVQVHENINTKITAETKDEVSLYAEKVEMFHGHLEENSFPKKEDISIISTVETVDTSMQTSNISVSCESQTSPDTFLKDTAEVLTENVSMQTYTESPVSVDNFMQTSPKCSFETETKNTSMQTEINSTENISSQAELIPEGIAVDIQTDKEELIPSVETSMQTDTSKHLVTATVDALSQTIQSGPHIMPASDSCIQTIVSELIPSVEDFTQTNVIQPITVTNTSVQTNKLIEVSEQPSKQESVESQMKSNTERKQTQEQENDSSSEEQLEVNIQALVVFPTESIISSMDQMSETKQSSPTVQADRESSISTESDKRSAASVKHAKKKTKKKTKRNKNTSEKKSEVSETSVNEEEEEIVRSFEISGNEKGIPDVSFIEQRVDWPVQEEILVTPTNAVRPIMEKCLASDEIFNDPNKYSPVNIPDAHEPEDVREYLEKDGQKAIILPELKSEISSKENESNLPQTSGDSVLVSDIYTSEQIGNSNLKITSDLTSHMTDVDSCKSVVKADPVPMIKLTKDENDANEQTCEITQQDTSKTVVVIPSRDQKPSIEKIELTTSVECSQRDVCYPRENEWKQIQCLVTDRVRKLQKERHATHLSGVLYLATLQQIVTDETFEQKNNLLQHKINALNVAVDSKDKVVIQKSVITIVQTISTWLENIEYHVLLTCQLRTAPTADHIKELGNLKQEIITVGQKVEVLDSVMELVYDMFDDDNDDVINMKQCIACLQKQVETMKEEANEKELHATKDLNRWEEFLNGVNNISVLIEELKEQVDQVVETDMLVHRKLEVLEQIESTNHSHQQKTTQLMSNAHSLLCDFPGHEVPPELYGAYETTRSIEHAVKLERDRQLQLIALADEYEQTLKEFAQIVDVADALVESSIVVSSLEHLQEEMQKHRKFFVNLSHCRCILESLEGNLDTETRNKHSGLHQQLHTRASGILDKAAGRAQQMALAASRWTVLEQGMKEERSWLQVAHQRVPDLQSVTSSDYDQYISLYQSLSADVAVHHGHCAQLIEVARRLQELVLCPGLEARYDEHLEVIAKLQEDINKNLHCLLSFRETWQNYVTLTEKLGHWMKYAEKELSGISSDDQHPGSNMKHFWELKAQYEVHNNIRNEANSNFNSAMRIIPVADENLQCQLHATIEERWWNVSSQIQNIQTAVLEILSNQDVPINDKLAALQQELQELQSALNDMHGVIKKEEQLELYIQRLQVMLGCVEHIQEELSRLGLLSIDETEKVGILLHSAGNIELQVKEELEGANILREKINAIQKGLNRIRRSHNNASNVLDQCEVSVTQGQDSVEQALRNCQGISEELTALWQDLMDLRQLLHTLPMSLHLTVSAVHLERNISQLQDHHSALEARSAHLLSLLKNRLAMWQHFEQQLELVQQSVQETDYMMELLTVQGSVDYDRLVKATECLEGLYGSLDQREDLLDELRVAAAPLAKTCAPEVSAKIKVAVEDVEKSWNNTRQTLRELCERYQDAARLWRQYREASDCVKTWAEQQLDSTAHLSPSEALRHVKVCEETLEAHQARLGDLRGLVAQIAADVGLDAGGPLADDVAALGRRLEDVRESLAALAEVAEAQQIGQDELQSTCDFLASVKQSLSMVEEANEKDIENQLSALRSHLLALGKTEGQLQTFKERSIDLSPSKSETSVVEILQLWQQVFRETFQHYHRLSARLVKSQDSAAALRLWQEYLFHVQSFLSSTIPEDYRGLTEHQHLCEVHQNLLMSQQSVLLAQNEGRTHPDGGLVELSVIEQFNSLTNLHNETLARIMERHSEVGDRLASWERYTQEQARLLSWLRDIERERSRLQLHNIHIRRIPKVLTHMQTMLEEKVPLGESQAQELLELQNNLFHNTDDTVAASVRLEYAAISQRITNLKAALETWKDFLDRINSLSATYEKNASNVQAVFQEIHGAICESQVLISRADIRNRLESLRNLRTRMLSLTSDLETMNVTLEQLRECLSPMDMKTLNQRTWLLWQSHNDLDHQLAVLCHQLEERINRFTLFEKRRSRFLVWVSDMEHRLDQICVGDPEEVLSRIQTEIQGDMALKCREFDWLLSTGHELIAATSGDDENATAEQNDLENKLSEVHRCWEDLQNLGAAKVNKLQSILQNLSRLEQQLSELRIWCHQIETQLMKPLVISECSEEVFERSLQEIEDLQNTIEQQSGNIAEILNVSELLLNDYELRKTTVNTEPISIATEAVEKRWKHICEVSTERKCNFMNTWKLLKNLLSLCEEKQIWIQIQEDTLGDIRKNIQWISPTEIQEQLLHVQNVLEEVQSQNQRLVVLDHSYSQLVKSCRMVPENLSPSTSLIHDTLQRWHALTPTATSLADLLCQELKMYRDFVNAHGKVVTNLTELDIRLTQLQHLNSPSVASQSNVSEGILQELEEELQSLNGLLLTADTLGMILLQKCKDEDQTSIQEMIDEYQLLRNDIKIRIASLRSQYLSEHDIQIRQIKERDESVQVETLRFEQDSAIQVNTLPHLSELTPKSLYGFEAAIQECKTNLSALKEVLEESPTDGSKMATLLAGAQSSIELVRHLSTNLFEKSEISEEQRRTSEVAALYSEYERLCSLACVQHQNVGENSESARLTCPLCSQFNWHQLDNDLWRLEQWLQFSEGTQRNYQVPPSNIEQLEDVIQEHRKFLMDLDGHKNIVMSLNIVGTHLADHADDEEKAEALRSRLEKTNMRWDAVCQAAAQWQSQLQHALMENPGFHRVIEELVDWLEKTETTIRMSEPVDLTEENSVVEAKYNKFRELHEEIERCEPRVMSLQDAADQLLRQSDAPENSILTRLISLRLRLQSLRRIIGIYILKLGAVLGHDPSELGIIATQRTGSGQNIVGSSLVSLSQELLEQAAAASSTHTETQHSNDDENNREDEVDTTVLTRGYQFFGRVLRASLPIQALMLLILGVASLVPSREEDYSCTLSNNLANSFEPLLFYPNGPPPV